MRNGMTVWRFPKTGSHGKWLFFLAGVIPIFIPCLSKWLLGAVQVRHVVARKTQGRLLIGNSQSLITTPVTSWGEKEGVPTPVLDPLNRIRS